MPGTGWRTWQSSGSFGSTRAAFVVLVAPGAMEGLGLMLKSLHAHVLATHPRPVLLFYGNDVPPEQYAPAALDRISPPQIRRLIEVRMQRPNESLDYPEHRSAVHTARSLLRV